MIGATAFLVGLFVVAVAAQAQEGAGPADELQRLEAGEVLITSHEVSGRSVLRIKARALVRAAPEKIWATITDVPRYKEWMPRILESQELSREGGEVVSRLQFDMPFP
ncbi:MAG: SRPBCC family protein, partial [Candidatus Binatia bacterium]